MHWQTAKGMLRYAASEREQAVVYGTEPNTVLEYRDAEHAGEVPFVSSQFWTISSKRQAVNIEPGLCDCCWALCLLLFKPIQPMRAALSPTHSTSVHITLGMAM